MENGTFVKPDVVEVTLSEVEKAAIDSKSINDKVTARTEINLFINICSRTIYFLGIFFFTVKYDYILKCIFCQVSKTAYISVLILSGITVTIPCDTEVKNYA